MTNRVDLKEFTLKRLDDDDRYQKVLSNVDEETRKKINSIIRSFIGDLSESLSKFDDPEIKKKLREILKDGR